MSYSRTSQGERENRVCHRQCNPRAEPRQEKLACLVARVHLQLP